MDTIITLHDKEILKQEDSTGKIRYYIISGWQKEIYNKVIYDMPVITEELTGDEYTQLIRSFRGKKLERILKEDLNFPSQSD